MCNRDEKCRTTTPELPRQPGARSAGRPSSTASPEALGEIPSKRLGDMRAWKPEPVVEQERFPVDTYSVSRRPGESAPIQPSHGLGGRGKGQGERKSTVRGRLALTASKERAKRKTEPGHESIR